jgi:hypothetical protein
MEAREEGFQVAAEVEGAPLSVWMRERLQQVIKEPEAALRRERRLATSVLGDYVADDAERLADLLMYADEQQFAVLFPKLRLHGARGLPVLSGEVDRKLPLTTREDVKERLAKRQANAAVALLKLNQPARVWPLLKHSPDPRVRSYLIHRFGPLGADVEVLVNRLAEEPDRTIRRALILSLGPEEFGKEAWTPEGKKRMVEHFAGNVPHGIRSGPSCGGGMAVAAVG